MTRFKHFLVAALIIASGFWLKDPLWQQARGLNPKDTVLLKNSPVLKHLALALPTSSIQRVSDLFDNPDEFLFTKAPNPTQLLQHLQQQNPKSHSDTAVPLKILSYNIALLDVELFGFLDYVRSPYLNERRFVLPHLILSHNEDVIFLQEVWRDEDVERFQKAAKEYGYRAFVGPRDHYNDGLMTLVKETLIAGAKNIDFAGEPFFAQDPLEFFPGPQIARGFQVVHLNHPALGPLHLYNVHSLAWAQKWFIRMQQVRELTLYAVYHSQPDDLVFIGGDMNSGPYYHEDTLKMPDGEVETGWWKNAIAYALFLHYGDLNDLLVMGRTAETAASDVDLAQNFHANMGSLQKNKLPAWCPYLPVNTFTGTDCNQLYRMQYAATEYPARLDHLFVRDLNHRVQVVHSGLAFTQKQRFHDVDIEPSDHFGVFVELFVERYSAKASIPKM